MLGKGGTQLSAQLGGASVAARFPTCFEPIDQLKIFPKLTVRRSPKATPFNALPIYTGTNISIRTTTVLCLFSAWHNDFFNNPVILPIDANTVSDTNYLPVKIHIFSFHSNRLRGQK